MFKPLTAMPTDLRAHIRYPEDLFLVQADIYRTYHMNDPQVFYNREDQWDFPKENYGGETGADAALLRDHAAARRVARGIHPDAADGAEGARQHDFVAGGALRRRRLRASVRVCVLEGQALLRPVSDSGAHQSEPGDFAPVVVVESDGLEGRSSAICW